jgi:hypothetical protein
MKGVFLEDLRTREEFLRLCMVNHGNGGDGDRDGRRVRGPCAAGTDRAGDRRLARDRAGRAPARSPRQGAWVGMVARSRATAGRGSRGDRRARDPGGSLAPDRGCTRSPPTWTRCWAARPDIVVNAAGVFSLAPLAAHRPRRVRAHLAVNLRARSCWCAPSCRACWSAAPATSSTSAPSRAASRFPGNGELQRLQVRPARPARGALGGDPRHRRARDADRAGGDRHPALGPARSRRPGGPALAFRRCSAPEDVARAVLFAVSQPEGVEISVLALRAAN